MINYVLSQIYMLGKWTIYGLLIQYFFAAMLYASDGKAQGTISLEDEKIEVIIQEIPITGKVTSEDGELPGANIIIKGTTTGTITDLQGNFALEVPDENAVLVFSSVGYISQEIVVGSQTVINIKLMPDITALDEIVVVGYGTQKRSDLTGSVAVIKNEIIEEMPVTSVDQALQGRIAGVNITNTSGMPGAGVSIRIRGSNSFSGSSEPLFVVDGVPYFNDNSGASAGSLTGDQSNSESNVENFNVLASLNPNDIASVEILKDASATAIYGSRGANGVVLITTKRGDQISGKINYGAWFGFDQITSEPDLMRSNEYAAYRNQRWEIRNPGGNPEDIPFPGEERINEDGETYYIPAPGEFDYSTDWLDEISQTGFTQSHNISFSGGDESTNYVITGNYFKQKGVILASELERLTGRMNINHKFSEKLRVNANMFYSRSANTTQASATGEISTNVGPILRALRADPTARIFNDDGTFWTGFDDNQTAEDMPNTPVSHILNTDVLYNTTQLTTMFSATYEIIDGLELTSRLGFLSLNSQRRAYYAPGTWLGDNTNGTAIRNRNSFTKPNWDNYINYSKKIADKHSINFTLGTSWEQGVRVIEQASSRNFPVHSLTYNALQAGTIIGIPFTDQTEFTLSSYYGRVNYSFNDKFLFTFTARADGSSRFAENNKWGFFPSGALAWRMSEEEFIRNIAAIDDLKLRVSYGETGNQAISPYQSLALLGFSNYNINGQLVSGITPVSLANPDLSWETTSQINAGIDLGILNNRVRFIADYYKKNTTDLLWRVNLPSTTGFSQAFTNLGEIENEGFEFSIESDVLDKNDYRLSFNLNLTTNRNEVLDLGDEELIPGPRIASNGVPFSVHAIQVGEALNSFWLYEDDGHLSQEDIDNGHPIFPGQIAGDIKYVDNNGDGLLTDEDKRVVGNPFPDFQWGLGVNTGYKGIGLDILVSGVQGVDVYNVNRQLATSISSFEGWNRVSGFVENTWTESNPEAEYPTLASVAQYRESARYLEDASFVRLANVRLSYDLKFLVQNTSWLSNAQVYFTGRNLLTFTDYEGFDPEVSAFGQDPRRPNVDFGGYPQIKSYVIGFNVGF